MELRNDYKRFEPLIKKGYVFDPESETFFTPLPESFQHPEDYEDWKVEHFDTNEYLKTRLQELGISEADNQIELVGGVDMRDDERQTTAVFSANKHGDIEILQYDLNRRPYLSLDSHSKKTDKRYVFQQRLHPLRAQLYDQKYSFSQGKAVPFWHKSLIELYESAIHYQEHHTEEGFTGEKAVCETLFITEGQFKAFKACMDGIPTVGLTSISHFKEKGQHGNIHHEIVDFIRACEVKKVVVLWDGDCRDISLKKLEAGEDISQRPNQFYNYSLRIKELLQKFFSAKRLQIFFATIQELDRPAKGIDDLLVSYADEKKEILKDFRSIGVRPGKFVEWFPITTEDGAKKLRKFFCLNSVQAFCGLHAEKIRNRHFVFFGTTYRFEKGVPIVEVSADLKAYKRIGPDWFRLVTDDYYNDDGDIIRSESVLAPWKVSEIIRDHGKDSPSRVEQFMGFTNVASHTNYQQVIGDKWNLYNDLTIENRPGEWAAIESLLRHLFLEQYEMALDYMTLLYTRPYQKLPVLCLVSKEEGTGKSTFGQLLQMIFQNNMATVSSDDIMGNWTSHWVSKLLVMCEETFFEKKEALEKIKNLSTADQVMRAERFVSSKMIPCIIKFVFMSNHEDDFIKLNSNSSRFWVVKVWPIKGDKNTEMKATMQAEIPHFVDFLLKRELTYKKKDRMYFGLDDIITDAWRNVVEQSEPNVIKDIRVQLEESFLKYGGAERLMATKDLITHFGIRGEINYLNKVIRNYLQVSKFCNSEGEEAVTTYKFPVDNQDDVKFPKYIPGRGRPWIFPAGLFVKSGLQVPEEMPEEDPEQEELAVIDTSEKLPF